MALATALLAAGCSDTIDAFPEPGNVNEAAEVIRQTNRGGIVMSFSSSPLSSKAPPDGVRLAVIRSLGRTPCSAAAFFWSEKGLAERWLKEQIRLRRQYGQPVRIILAGHGLGATAAAEAAKEMLARDPELEIVLLLTVDAVKTSRITSAAGVTGNVITHRIPGVNTSFTAYDSAPIPDGVRLQAHINYYQDKTPYYHGSPMPGAENHYLSDWTGTLNHGSADNFAFPLLVSDLRAALRRGMQ